MPFISFESGQLTKEMKEQLIEQLTQVSADITGIPKEAFILSIREMPNENISAGGKTVAKIREERAAAQGASGYL